MQSSVTEVRLALSYFGAFEGDLYDAFMKSARNPTINESYTFFHTTDVDCAHNFGIEGTSIVLIRNFDESPLKFEMNTEEELVAFAKANSIPRLFTFGEDYVDAIFTDHNYAIILFTEEKDEHYQSVYEFASLKLEGEILFGTSGISEGLQSRLGEFMNINQSMMPAIRILAP